MDVQVTPHEQDIFWISVLVYTVLSGLGSLFIIVSVLLKFRTDFSARLVMYLSIADLLLSVTCFGFCAYNLSQGYLHASESVGCQIQSFITWYLLQASILWLMAIALNSYKVMFYRDHFTVREEVITSLICWLLPVITAALPLNRGSLDERYGQRNGVWCSFDDNHKSAQIGNLLVYYIPALIVICFCYGRIGYHVSFLGKLEQTGSSNALKIRAQRKMFFYCLSYFVVWTPLTICYIYEAASGKFIPFWAEYISANLLHFQGVFNMILYGITQDLMKNSCIWFKSMASTASKSSSKSADLP